MKSDRSYFIVGLFVLVGIAALMFSVVLLDDGSKSKIVIRCETLIQDSVSGLDVGSTIRFRGIAFGKVTSVSLANLFYETDSDLVLVRFDINPATSRKSTEEIAQFLRAKVTEGLRFRVQSNALTGASYLEGDMIEEPEPAPIYDWLPSPDTAEYLFLPSAPGVIAQILADFQDFVKELKKAEIAKLVNTLTSKIDELDVKGVNKNLQDVLVAAEQLIVRVEEQAPGVLEAWRVAGEDIGKAGNEATGLLQDPKIREMLANGESATGRLDEILADPNIAASVANIEGLTADLRGTVVKIDEAIAQVDKLVVTGRKTITSRDRDLDIVLQSLSQIARNIESLTGIIERYPSLVLFGQPPEPVRPDK